MKAKFTIFTLYPGITMIFLRAVLKLLFVFPVLISCKKGETFEAAPDNTFNFSMTFNPEYSGTLTANLNSADNGLSFYHTYDPYNYLYGVKAKISRKYFNEAINLNTTITYDLNINFRPNSMLTTGTYLYTATSSVTTTGQFTTKDAYGQEYGWYSYPSNSNIFFNKYANSYTKIIITNIYTRKLKDGVHTYAAGSIDATMLSLTSTDMNGNPLKPQVLESQLHLQCSFSGAEISG